MRSSIMITFLATVAPFLLVCQIVEIKLERKIKDINLIYLKQIPKEESSMLRFLDDSSSEKNGKF